MSVSDRFFAPGQALGDGSRDEIRPLWLRPVALTAILVVHALVFVTYRSQRETLSPGDVIAVTLAPLGDAAKNQRKQDEVKPAAPPPPPVEKIATPRPAPLEATPTKVFAPEAVPLPIEPPKSATTRLGKRVREKRLVEKREQEKMAERRRKAQEARQDLRRGDIHGAAHQSSLSPAAYGGLLRAEIQRHMFYPSAARAADVTGVVGVAFTIGPTGRLTSLSVTRSSGSSILDAAARTTLRAIHAPPPPDGRFSTSTNIRFHLN